MCSCNKQCTKCGPKPCTNEIKTGQCCACGEATIYKKVDCEGKHVKELPKLLNPSNGDLLYIYDISEGKDKHITLIDLINLIDEETGGDGPLDPGTFGDPLSVPVVVVGVDGSITSITEVPIGLSMDDLLDVASGTIVAGQLLQYDGANYVPVTLASIAFTGDFSDLIGVPPFITDADGVNVGGEAEVYKDNLDANTLRFRTIEAGDDITVTQNADTITIGRTPTPYGIDYRVGSLAWGPESWASTTKTLWLYNVPAGVWVFHITVQLTITGGVAGYTLNLNTGVPGIDFTQGILVQSSFGWTVSTTGYTSHSVGTLPSITNVAVNLTAGASNIGNAASIRCTAIRLA